MTQDKRQSDDHCSSCNGGYSVSGRVCTAMGCQTGGGAKCKACRDQAVRTAANQCATCNDGYERI